MWKRSLVYVLAFFTLFCAADHKADTLALLENDLETCKRKTNITDKELEDWRHNILPNFENGNNIK